VRIGREGVRLRALSLWSVGVIAVALLILSSLGVFSTTTVRKSTVVSSLTSSRYGSVLVVGGSSSGGLYHFPLYEFSGDVHGHLGCGTTKTKGYDLGAKESVPLTCTGPEGDLLADVSSDDWPALTTKGAPIAGPGVKATLLGTIHRPGIGDQITYAGHPLYLFDPSSQPFTPQGENFMETVTPLPPWHGYWYLTSARTGAPSPGVATLEVETLANGKHALAVVEDGNVDPIEVTLYSGVGAPSGSACDATCSKEWTPVLTSASPIFGPGVNRALVSITPMSSGSYEVTYDHRTLYLYDEERVRLSPNDHVESGGSAGNGDGVRGPDGVMSVIPQPT
jgi:predicted lipoprotein with Yx(FWY)xxD motif